VYAVLIADRIRILYIRQNSYRPYRSIRVDVTTLMITSQLLSYM